MMRDNSKKRNYLDRGIVGKYILKSDASFSDRRGITVYKVLNRLEECKDSRHHHYRVLAIRIKKGETIRWVTEEEEQSLRSGTILSREKYRRRINGSVIQKNKEKKLRRVSCF